MSMDMFLWSSQSCQTHHQILMITCTTEINASINPDVTLIDWFGGRGFTWPGYLEMGILVHGYILTCKDSLLRAFLHNLPWFHIKGIGSVFLWLQKNGFQQSQHSGGKGRWIWDLWIQDQTGLLSEFQDSLQEKPYLGGKKKKKKSSRVVLLSFQSLRGLGQRKRSDDSFVRL